MAFGTRGFENRRLKNQPRNGAKPVLTKDNSFLVFPFDIVAGYTTSTESGIRNNDTVEVADFSTFQRVFTGLENILAVWQNSWIVSKENDDDTFLTKKPQPGRSFRAFIPNESMSASFEPSTVSNDFLAEFTDEEFTLFTYDDIEVKDLFRLYIVPGLKEEKWLYTSRAEKYYNKDKTLDHVEITLTTLNNKVAKSGGAIEEFIQRSAPGEGYSWPELNTVDDKVGLNEIKLRDIPVTSFQEEYSGPAGFNTLFAYGRPTIQKTENGQTIGTFNPHIEAPRILFPLRLETPVPSPLNTRPSAEGNWYSGMFTPTLWSQYDSWKEQFVASYNLNQRAKYEGVLISVGDKASITQSNPLNNGQYDHIIWDKEFKPTIDQSFDTSPNDKTPEKITVKGDISITEMLSHNIFATSYIDALPLQKEQNVVWNVSSLPIIGGFASKLIAGVPAGWNDRAIKLKADSVWLATPTSLVEYGSVLAPDNEKSVFIPLETFTGKRGDDATEYSGINATGSIFKTQLTDRFTKTINNKEYTFNSVDLGQNHPLKDDEGIDIDNGGVALPNKLQWDGSCKPTSRSANTPGYVIDTATTKTLAKLEYRRTFFSNDEQVWTGTYQTRSLFTGSIRDWDNTMKMSFWEAINNEKVNYPANISAPNPPNANNPQIEITDFIKSYSLFWRDDNGNANEATNLIDFEDARKGYWLGNAGGRLTWKNDNGVLSPETSKEITFDTTPYGGLNSLRTNYKEISFTIKYFDKDVINVKVDLNQLITTGKATIQKVTNIFSIADNIINNDTEKSFKPNKASSNITFNLTTNGTNIEIEMVDTPEIIGIDKTTSISLPLNGYGTWYLPVNRFVPKTEITKAIIIPKQIV